MADDAMPASESEQVRGALESLARIAEFGRGWDGYSGLPIERELLAIAAVLVRTAPVDALIAIGPGSDGSLDVEFRNERRVVTIVMQAENRER